ncbi:hypothetical protein VKT23_004728 [Stygiomarasmius scandens]|uniref:Uncharacterized protein n=1 Tax=Marasmiellus scandens TaxID=2682957 RepID=A0ABR1JY30_9AGAR
MSHYIGRKSSADAPRDQPDESPSQRPVRAAKLNAIQKSQQASQTKKRKSVATAEPAPKKNKTLAKTKPAPIKKTGTPKTNSGKPRKKYGAVEIDVDNPNPEVPAPSQPKKPAGGKRAQATLQEMNDRLENEESDLDSEEESDPEDERENDRDAVKHFDDEYQEHDSNNHREYHRQSSSRASAASSIRDSTPPATDFDDVVLDDRSDGQLEDTSDNELLAQTRISTVPKAPQKVSTRKAQQLAYELPQVSSENLPMSRHAAISATIIKSTSALTTAFAPCWMERTNIIVVGKGCTWSLGISTQPPVMQKVIDGAIQMGKLRMLTDHQICPLGEDLKALAMKVLIQTALNLGYDGENDVAHRMEKGDDDLYIKPLQNYVSQHIGAVAKRRQRESKRVRDEF